MPDPKSPSETPTPANVAAGGSAEPLREDSGSGDSGSGESRAFSGGGKMTMSSDNIPAPPNPFDYRPDILTLYGMKLNQSSSASLPFGNNFLELDVYENSNHLGPDKVSVAAIYGYAFEGHCYRLDKPKLLIIKQDNFPAKGCGFTPPYQMWHITSKTMVMEVGLNFDTAEKLVLDSNLPGNRAPNTYGNNMALGHRGGKLNRPGT